MLEEHLINEVKKCTFLYNKCDRLYRDKLVKKKAWVKIAAAVGLSPKHCLTRWKLLRDRYVKETTKQSASRSAASEEEKQWKYTEALSFLKDHVLPKLNKPKDRNQLDISFAEKTETQHIHRTNIHSYCRTCLTELPSTSSSNELKYDIHQTQDLAKWITICTSIETVETDGYPKFLCWKCFTKFQSFYKFRKMCIRSMRILDNIFYTTDYDFNNDTSDDISQNDLVAKTQPLDNEEESPENTEGFEEHISIDPLQNRPEEKTMLTSIDIMRLENIEVVNMEKFNGSEVENNNEPPVSNNCSYTLELENDEESSTEDLSWKENNRAAGTMDMEDENSGTEQKHHQNSYEKRNIELATSFEMSENRTIFKCGLCKKRFYSQGNLEIHMQIHQGFQRFQCNQCERSYKRAAHLASHIREVHECSENELTCCGKKFKQLRTYRTHCRLYHSNVNPDNFKTFICEDCGRIFRNFISLKRHRFTHTSVDEYPFKCVQCGKGYTEHRRYKQHLLRHVEHKKYECTYCGVKKDTRSELRFHINCHTKENQWPCPICPSVFNSSEQLGMHDRVVHNGVRRYACRYCEQRFGSSKILKHHEMRHTGEKPHECHICGKRFIQHVALQAHVKTHDKIGRKNSNKNVEISGTDLDF